MCILAHLRDDLRQLHIPLITVSYNSTTMHDYTSTTTNKSTSSSSAVSYQQAAPSARHVVTPLRKAGPPLHPLASVLLAICTNHSASTHTSTANSSASECMVAPASHTTPTTSRTVHAVSVGTVTSTTHAEPDSSHSLHSSVPYNAHNDIHDNIHDSTVLTPAALFTDDCLHPLYCYVCKIVALHAPALPIIAVDSNTLPPHTHIPGQSSSANHHNAVPSSPMDHKNGVSYMSYESYEKEFLSRCSSGDTDGAMCSTGENWPSPDALKVRFCLFIYCIIILHYCVVDCS